MFGMKVGHNPVGKIRHQVVGALTSLPDFAYHFPPPAAIMASLIAQTHAIWFFLRISSHFEKTRNDTSLHNPFPGVYETLMYL